jgi:hypothetical protein
MSDEKLTPEQIKNWRKVLCSMIGALALIMHDSEVQAFRNKLQGGLTSRAGDLATPSNSKVSGDNTPGV